MTDSVPCPHCGELVPPLAQICAYCGRGLSGRALIKDQPKNKSGTSSSTVAKVFWGISLLCTALGSLIGIGGFAGANGAPQEAAAAAIGCLIVIAPYVFARAIDALLRD